LKVPPDQPDSSIDLLFLLNQASFALAAEMEAALQQMGISVRQYCVLWKAQGADMTQKQIADAALLDKTTMVDTVDALETAGLAERRPSPIDRRVRLLALTPRGRKVLAGAGKVIDDLVDDVLSSLPPPQRANLVSGLASLVAGRLADPSHVSRQRPRKFV
jgi:DNA-binding MarR family transcriptional regulator